MEDEIAKEVILVFPENELICKEVIAQKKKYHNKKMLIAKAPIFPLKTCIKCPSCYLGVQYKPYIAF